MKPLGKEKARTKQQVHPDTGGVYRPDDKMTPLRLSDRLSVTNEKVTFCMGKDIITAQVQYRNKVPVLTVRALHGGLIILPDMTNQIGVIVSNPPETPEIEGDMTGRSWSKGT